MFKYTIYRSYFSRFVINRITVMGSIVTLYDARPGKEAALARVFAKKGRKLNFLETVSQDFRIHPDLHDEMLKPSPHIHFEWPYNDNSLEADLLGLLDLILVSWNFQSICWSITNS